MVLDKTSAKNLKKIIHNGIERTRKQRIFNLIDEIIECLPFKHEFSNKSKRQKLERIHTYIIDLKNKNDALMFANPKSVLGMYFSLVFCPKNLNVVLFLILSSSRNSTTA